VAGHSYGAAIALQWALDHPDEVRSVAVLEAPLFHAIPSGPGFWEGVSAIRQNFYDRNDKAGATDAFLRAVISPDYRVIVTKSLPPTALEMAVVDLDTFFQVELPALQGWRFNASDAARIRQPVLVIVGTQTVPFFSEGHALLKQWIPRADELVVREATHGLQIMKPRDVAEGLAEFLGRHSI
jgi:3-oxoadipate enol-lactonase